MILGDFCLKENSSPKLLFHCVGTIATAFYNHTILLQTKQTVSPLLLFHLNGASERNVIPATERHRAIYIATRWCSLRSKSNRYYPKRVI